MRRSIDCITFYSRLERVACLVNRILMIPVVKTTFNDLYYTITGDSSRALGYPRARDKYRPWLFETFFFLNHVKIQALLASSGWSTQVSPVSSCNFHFWGHKLWRPILKAHAMTPTSEGVEDSGWLSSLQVTAVPGLGMWLILFGILVFGQAPGLRRWDPNRAAQTF